MKLYSLRGNVNGTAKISADTKVAKGDKIKLGIQEQKMHLFDPISEKAIL